MAISCANGEAEPKSLPIQNKNLSALFLKLVLTDSGCNAGVVEQTKSHSGRNFGVVARGSDDSYSIFYSALEDCAARLNGASGAELGRKVRELVEIYRVKMGSFRQLNEFIVVHFYYDQLSEVCEIQFEAHRRYF
jgi:hypothetical protein